MKKILSVFMALCTVLTTLCIPPAPVTAQSTEMLISEPIDETVTLPVEEEPITLETLAEDCKILQHVDEEAFTAADHAFRLPDLEELDTYVFQNQDGTRSIYYLYENVKFYDEQGNIREKDNTLQRETKGFRITENEFDLLLPHAVTDGVELTYQGYEVKLIPATEGNPTTIQLGTLQDNSVVYESFFGAGTSLAYTPLLSGVKEEIVLEEYLPNRTFSFLLYTDGLFLNNTDGSYILTESKASTEAVLYLGNIVVYDAVGRPSLGNLAVETVKDGTVYALTVSADEDFLADPATVYPVTIDPDITISDANNGSGAIEDTTVFNGTPNLNTGDWVYNTAGYVDETYGAGRILVRLPGLYNSEVYQGLTANRILSATFYITKSSSKVPDYVNLYCCTGTTWGETTATWNNAADNYTNGVNWGTSSVSSSAVSFNITSLVKAWRSGTYSAQAGFMLVNQNETDVSKKFGIYASEHSNTEKRPYFVLTCEPKITINASKLELVIGDRTTLVATTHPAGMAVMWEAGDSNVIGIDSGGNVIARRAGQTTVYAKVTDATGEYTAQCSVYVRIVDGVYRVTNLYSANCLQATGMNILPETTVTQSDQLTIPTQSSDDISALAQLWRFAYIGSGYYSIRPYYKTDMGLFRETSNVFLNTLGTSNASDSVPLEAKWTLAWGTSGYMIKGRGLSIYTLQSEKNLNGTSVSVAPNTGDFECQWRLTRITSLPSGVALYESDNGIPLANGIRAIAVGETKTLTELNITAVAYSPSSASQNITVTVASNATAEGITITGTATGTTTVTVSCTGNSDSLTASFALNVVPLKPGMYFLQNRQNEMFADIEGPDMRSGTEIHQWEFHSASSQRWIFSYVDEGYYTICSANSDNLFYLGVENNSQETDANIVLRTGTPDNGMLWKIVSTSEGAFRLYPKLAESQTTPRALVATTSDDSNGDRLAYGNYVVNTSYRDEWLLSTLENYPNILLGCHVPSTVFIIQCTGSAAQSSEWYPLIQEAAMAWNALAGFTITVSTTTQSPFTCEVGSYDETWYGLNSYSCKTSGEIVKSSIKINAETCADENNPKKSTITHEIGHLLGLADNPPVGDNDSLMNHGRERDIVYQPQPYDVTNVKYIYEN